MNRPICVLTIIVIVAIIGLHSCGVVFFDYDKVYELDGATQDFEGIILGKKSETDYKATYIIEINEAQNSYTQKNNSKNNEIGETNENMQNENEQEDNYSMVIYFVKKGDTLWKIAKEFKSTVDDIKRVNGIENENVIDVGKQLFIPRYSAQKVG